MKKIFASFIISLCLLTPFAQADDVQVSASLSKRSVRMGEEVRLNIKISGPSTNLQAPRLPKLDAFETYYTGRASRIAFVNGVSTSNVEFTYTLIPQRSGHFVIPPIEVAMGIQTLQTESLAIDVEAGQAQAAQAPIPSRVSQPMAQSAPSAIPADQEPVVSPDGDNNIFVQAWVDRKEAYQNEQLLLTYSLYTRYDTRYEGFDKEPQTSGFWIEEFPMERDVERETVKMNGKRYVKADVKKLALFATAPGNYTIQPGSLKVSIRDEPQNANAFDEFFSDSFFTGGAFFARRQNRLLNPPVIQLTVKSLPEEGKPKSFQGAVGRFRISAMMDKQTVKQNEPVTLKVTIEGEGNIETINRPKVPELTGFKTYDADTSSQLYKTGNVIGGVKRFEIVFIPKEEGKTFIPPLEFSYFDPRQGKYEILQTPNFPLEVEHSEQSFQMPEALTGKEIFQKQVKLEGKDIRYIDEKLSESVASRLGGMFYRFLIGLDLLLFLVWIALWGKDRQEQLFSKDQALRRRKIARPTAMGNMKRLVKLARSSKDSDVAVFFDELEKAMTQYITDKWNLSTYGVTRRDLEDALVAHFGSEDEHLKDVLSLYQLCDESRFGKGAIPQASKKMGMDIFRDTVNRIERMKT